MVTRLRCGARSILWVLVLLMLMQSSTRAHRPVMPDDSGRATILAGHRASEVRLRKLHLVRPDLIPYPIALEVYC